MKRKNVVEQERNWLLVFIASMLIILGLVLVAVSAMNAHIFGWWSLLIGLYGLATIASATMSIVKNDPRWIMLDLIMPWQ